MQWTIITNMAWAILKFMINRSSKKDKAEKSFMDLVKRMDKLAKENTELREKYIGLKEDLRKQDD